MKSLLEKEPSEIFDALIKHLPDSSLRDFLVRESLLEPSLIHRFIIFTVEETKLPVEEKYLLKYRSIVQLSQYDVQKSSILLDFYLQDAEKLFETQNYFDAFLMASNLIREYPVYPSGQNNNSSVFFSRSLHLLTEISNSDAGIDLKEKIFELLMKDGQEELHRFSSADKLSWLNSLIAISHEEEQVEQVLIIVNDFIGKNRSQFAATIDDSQEEQLWLLKLRLYEKLNRHDDARRLMQSKSNLKVFRLKLIDQCLAENKLEEAKELIKDGKRLEERNGKLAVSDDWDRLLLKIAQLEGDVKSIRNLTLQFFISSEFNFEYYYLLRKQYDATRWKLQLDRIIRLMKEEKTFATIGIHAAAKVFIEEEQWDKLLLLLQKNANLEFIESYFDLLKEKFPGELLEIYRRAVRRFTEKNMGNGSYRAVANTLKKMQSLPGGREMVQSLAIELKVDYRQRKSFVQELNKVAL